MSLLQNHADRATRKAARRIEGSLDHREVIELAAWVVEGRHPMHPALIVGMALIAVSVFLSLDGLELGVHVIGLSIGLSAGVAMARHARWVFVTDRGCSSSRHTR